MIYTEIIVAYIRHTLKCLEVEIFVYYIVIYVAIKTRAQKNIMGPNIHLILHNTIAITSVIFAVCLIIFLLINDHQKTVNITLASTAFFVIIFELSHVFGVSATNSELSRMILMGNLSVIFVNIFCFHCVIVALGKYKERRVLMLTIYLIGICMTIFFILNSHLYLSVSTSKMYFPNYYVVGPLSWIEDLTFQTLIPILYIFELVHSYLKQRNVTERKRIKWLGLAIALGWFFSFLTVPLAYNIPIDPMYGIFFPIVFCVPFTYAVLNHDLLDIKVVAKRAFYYGILVAACAGILIFLNFINEWIEEIMPGTPVWVVPLFSSAFAVAVGIAVWKKVREGDALKYQFINKTMHELRTPLTHIKLSAENLVESGLDETQKASLATIEKANEKLIELTDLVKERAK